MTIQREPPGIWRVVCDTCGDDILLDTEGSRKEADDEVYARGWSFRLVRSLEYGKRQPAYHEHNCPDCD